MKILAFAALSLLSVTAFADHSPDQIARFKGPVNQMDVVGGYASTHVIVQVAPGIEPAQLGDGRPTLARAVRRGLNAAEAELAAALEQVQATEIVPATPFELKNRELAKSLGLDRYFLIRVPHGTDTRQLVASLQTFDGLIDRAEVDGIGGVLDTMPNDASFNLQYGLRNTGQSIQGQVGTAGADIKAAAAWDLHTGTADITIAVIDTGIATSHPDLVGKLVTGYNAIDGSSNVGDSILIPH